MRIAIVTRIYRPEPSAASMFLGAVSDSLTTSRVEVDVLTTKPPVQHADTPKKRGLEHVFSFPVLRDSSGYVRGYLQYMSFDIPLCFRLLFLRKPDVVFVEPPPTTGAVVRIICALRRIPYVYDAADIWSDAAQQATSSRAVLMVVRALEQFAMRGATAMVTISQPVVDRVRALDVKTPATVTGFGADTRAFSYTPARSTDKVFLYGGTHSEVQGADILIHAFAEFSRTHRGYRLEFVGNGANQTGMREVAERLHISKSVSFEEPVSTGQLNSRFSTALASLATLRPDGGYEYAFATKIYSSLAAGCPVLFAGPGPTSAFIEDANGDLRIGVAVDYDAKMIAEAMREIADKPLSPADRSRVAGWTATHHSLRYVAEKVATVIIGSANRHPRETR